MELFLYLAILMQLYTYSIRYITEHLFDAAILYVHLVIQAMLRICIWSSALFRS